MSGPDPRCLEDLTQFSPNLFKRRWAIRFSGGKPVLNRLLALPSPLPASFPPDDPFAVCNWSWEHP
jgi:hypothetical protein